MFESLGVADWVVWYLISQYVGMGVFGLYYLYRARFKIGYIAVFVRKAGSEAKDKEVGEVDFSLSGVKEGKGLGGDYVYVGEREFKKSDTFVTFGKRTFPIDFGLSCYRKFGYTCYVFDFESGSVLRYGGEVRGLDPLVAERHLRTGVWEKILLSVSSLPRAMWILIFVVVVMVGVGAGLGGYLLGSMGNHTVVV